MRLGKGRRGLGWTLGRFGGKPRAAARALFAVSLAFLFGALAWGL
jgi:hypothetical protein